MKRLIPLLFGVALVVQPRPAQAQPFDILSFDPISTGPWSQVGRTTLMVPKVANGSIQLNGASSALEYGGFEPVTVTPGDNAWILDFPGDRAWDGPEDSSFTFWLAHDDDNLYVGVSTKDDVVNSDDPNGDFWKDDAIEIVVDALADRLDNNTDSSEDKFGGHSYVNYEGRFSAWDEAANAIGRRTWATGVPWTYGANGEVFGVGQTVAGGWQVEVRFRKTLFEDPAAGNRLRNGYRMGFNIGLDDDDKKGQGTNGDASRSEDLEIQYFWANRQRYKGLTAEYLEGLTPEERASKAHLQNLEFGVDSAGRLAHGGTGEILFGFDENAKASGKILFVTSDGASPINADPALIALLRAKGYTVTVFTANGSTSDDLRAAAAGQGVVIVSETIGSTTVLEPPDATGVFSLKDTDVPIIAFEPYIYDNADWTPRTEDGSNDFINWGNTSRTDLPDEAIHDARDSLYIQRPTHPIVGSLTGKVKVYEPAYSLNFGKPSAEADVIASVQPDGTYPTIFVYERGKKLVDGSVAPNKRIALFIGQAANPNANTPLDYADLTEAGRTLFLNTVAYALGTTGQQQPAQLQISRSGNELVLTFSAGTLQSADTITGPWVTETAASPVTIRPDGAAKFYRLQEN